MLSIRIKTNNCYLVCILRIIRQVNCNELHVESLQLTCLMADVDPGFCLGGASLQGPKVADVTEWSRVSETGKLLCFQCTIMHSITF